MLPFRYFLTNPWCFLGYIRLRKALDYEGTKKYTFTVVATDGGGKAATANVEILVEDVNDNTPAFQGSPYRANVAENVRIGHEVGRVQATDADSGPRGRISYSIDSGANSAFRINAAGKLTACLAALNVSTGIILMSSCSVVCMSKARN